MNCEGKEKKGAAAVIFRETENDREYLILHRILVWKGYEFVKGGIEENENPEDAVKREIIEETRLEKTVVLGKLNKKMLWKSNGCYYDYIVFVAKANGTEKVILEDEPQEHDSFEWLTKEKALEKLSHKETRESFESAVKEIEEGRIHA